MLTLLLDFSTTALWTSFRRHYTMSDKRPKLVQEHWNCVVSKYCFRFTLHALFWFGRLQWMYRSQRWLTCKVVEMSVSTSYSPLESNTATVLRNRIRGAGMAQWWEHSPPTNVAWVRFPDPASNVGWVCWFSSLHWEVFSGYSGFPSPQKPKFGLSVLIVNLSYSVPN